MGGLEALDVSNARDSKLFPRVQVVFLEWSVRVLSRRHTELPIVAVDRLVNAR